jgi:putative PIN family toxin of toxin-antitoxin system
MSRPRIVIDTNVLVSAALKPQGQQALVLQLVAFRVVEMCVSEEVLAEYREVLNRPKFACLDQNDVSRLLAMIEAEATMVSPTRCLAISEHDSDNRFYECADAASAGYIVTGNAKHFRKSYKTTKIITGRELLELLTGKSAL